MIYIIPQTKGGVGKTTLSFNVIPLFLEDNNFEIIEIDDNNKSAEKYDKSELLKNKCRTIKVAASEDELDLIFFDALANEKSIIIDAGGGNDSVKILEYLAMQPAQDMIKYVIPIQPADDPINLIDTYNLIENKDNIMICFNAYQNVENIKKDFVWVFGDKSIGIESQIEKLECKTIAVPYSPLFLLAKKHGMTLYDLAELSSSMTTDQASKKFIEDAEGDPKEYHRLYSRYKASLKAQKVIDEIKNNLQKEF